jgi:hypothetical protein
VQWQLHKINFDFSYFYDRISREKRTLKNDFLCPFLIIINIMMTEYWRKCNGWNDTDDAAIR